MTSRSLTMVEEKEPQEDSTGSVDARWGAWLFQKTGCDHVKQDLSETVTSEC